MSGISFHTEAPPSTGTAWRALRDDVALRFVAFSPAGPYEVAVEEGDPDGAGGVLLVEPFEVAPEEDERFAVEWDRLRERFTACQGYLGTRLYRAPGPAGFRFVYVARWSSPLMYARASQRPDAVALSFPSQPALYVPAGR